MNFKKYILLLFFIGGIAISSCESPSTQQDEHLEEEEHLENIEHTPEEDSIADRDM